MNSRKTAKPSIIAIDELKIRLPTGQKLALPVSWPIVPRLDMPQSLPFNTHLDRILKEGRLFYRYGRETGKKPDQRAREKDKPNSDSFNFFRPQGQISRQQISAIDRQPAGPGPSKKFAAPSDRLITQK
jgi:hypothetical protein